MNDSVILYIINQIFPTKGEGGAYEKMKREIMLLIWGIYPHLMAGCAKNGQGCINLDQNYS